MATNGFEASRISEGTMHAGAQHVSNLPRPMFDTPRDPGTKEVLDGHPILTKETTAPRVLRTANVTGASVHNRTGDKLGRIEDLIIDVQRGRVAYAAVSFGGFLGIGDKFFMVPWSALTYESRSNEFILDIDRDALEKAPGFDRSHWPDMADPTYGAGIHRHYGQNPYWAGNITDFSSEESAANRCSE